MLRENFEHGLVGGINHTVFHRVAYTEINVEALVQIDVAQFAALNRQSMCFCDSEVGLHVTAQALTKLWC